MPEDSSPGHCIAAFTTAITYFAIELGTYFNLQMTTKYGPDWFHYLEEVRQAANPKYRASRSCFDFSWIINEPSKNVDSPIRELLPKNEYQFYKSMRDLLEARNRWFHDYNPHNIDELSRALDLVQYLATKCQLQLEEAIKPVVKRVREIKSGAYAPNKGDVPEVANTDNTATASQVRQSAVGAAWLGPLGLRKLQLSASGSLIDLDAAKNVSAELTETQKRSYLPLWKALGIDWLWVNETGAVAANVYGSLRMVGFLGDKADDSGQDPFAKFLLPSTYTIAAGMVIDRANQSELQLHNNESPTFNSVSKAIQTLDEFDILRVTWDGDLIHFGESGPIYFGPVSSSEWFANHFLTRTQDVQ